MKPGVGGSAQAADKLALAKQLASKLQQKFMSKDQSQMVSSSQYALCFIRLFFPFFLNLVAYSGLPLTPKEFFFSPSLDSPIFVPQLTCLPVLLRFAFILPF